MTTSESLDTLAGALAKAQGAMQNASKDSTNPYFKSKYADLASVWESCRKPLSDNGLSIVQSIASEKAFFTAPIVTKDKQGNVTGTRDEVFMWLTVTTRLLHSSAQWIEESVSLPIEADSQAVGRVTTYLRRYALMSIVGVSADDDDGNADAEANRNRQFAPQAAAPAQPAAGQRRGATAPVAQHTPVAQPSEADMLREWKQSVNDGFAALSLTTPADMTKWVQVNCPLLPTSSRDWKPAQWQEVSNTISNYLAALAQEATDGTA